MNHARAYGIPSSLLSWRAEYPRLSLTTRKTVQNHSCNDVRVPWKHVPEVTENCLRHTVLRKNLWVNSDVVGKRCVFFAIREGCLCGVGYLRQLRGPRSRCLGWECVLAFVPTRRSRFRHQPPRGSASRVFMIRTHYGKRLWKKGKRIAIIRGERRSSLFPMDKRCA